MPTMEQFQISSLLKGTRQSHQTDCQVSDYYSVLWFFTLSQRKKTPKRMPFPCNSHQLFKGVSNEEILVSSHTLTHTEYHRLTLHKLTKSCREYTKFCIFLLLFAFQYKIDTILIQIFVSAPIF